MDLNEAVTVAVALKCLILMAAIQSVKAGSCFDSSKQIQTCSINEILKLTVLNRTTIEQNREQIAVIIDAVVKSDSKMTDGTLGFIRIPEGHACALDFIPDFQFLLIANHVMSSASDAIELCEIAKNVTYCLHVVLLSVMKHDEFEFVTRMMNCQYF